MKIIFLGPPGSGKGTYSSRLKTKFNIPHISTGELFRENISKETEIGKIAKGHIDKGELVPDEIVIEMLKKRLNNDDTVNGYILDGFPRTIEQAIELDKIAKIEAVINLLISDDILIEKMLARRTCEKCGEIYNVADIKREGIIMPPMLPKQEGICDKCGGKIIKRQDDNEDIIRNRFKIYREQTAPLIEYYSRRGVLVNVQITGPPEPMIEKITFKLKQLKVVK